MKTTIAVRDTPAGVREKIAVSDDHLVASAALFIFIRGEAEDGPKSIPKTPNVDEPVVGAFPKADGIEIAASSNVKE